MGKNIAVTGVLAGERCRPSLTQSDSMAVPLAGKHELSALGIQPALESRARQSQAQESPESISTHFKAAEAVAQLASAVSLFRTW